MAHPPCAPQKYFNSQPHKEADRQHTIPDRIPMHFNSQPHKEADGYAALLKTTGFPFQLTASQGG